MELLRISLFFLTVSFVCGARLARRAQLVGSDHPLKSSYDFVVVGGGTSGLTVADRLTENPESEIFRPLGSFGWHGMITLNKSSFLAQ